MADPVEMSPEFIALAAVLDVLLRRGMTRRRARRMMRGLSRTFAAANGNGTAFGAASRAAKSWWGMIEPDLRERSKP